MSTESGKTEKKNFATRSFVDVYFLAMTIALGGQYNRWNDPINEGFWSTFMSLVFNGIGYVCFAACMAEMASTLPFSGGIYGFVRAFVGPFSGYIVSRFEMIMIICYVAALVQSIGTFPTDAGISSEAYEPLWWLFFFVTSTGVALVGCNYDEYWWFIRLMGGFSLLLLIIYILGSFAYVDYDRYVSRDESMDVYDFESIYETAGMFRGVQYLPLISIKLADAKKDLPKGMFYSILSLIVTAIGVVFTASLQFPGSNSVLGNATYPLSFGFSQIFHISQAQAHWLSFPALYASFYGFVWAYGRQLSAMAKSGLLPEMIGTMTEATDTPYVALLVGMICSFVLALFCHYNVFYITFVDDVKHMYMLSSYVIYIFMFISYIIFKYKYSSLTRNFLSPLGITGAILGMIVFIINAIAILMHLQSEQYPLYFMFVSTLFLTIYYFLVLHGNQQFSEEEKEKLFKAYLINANVKSRTAMKKRQRGSGGTGNRSGLRSSSDQQQQRQQSRQSKTTNNNSRKSSQEDHDNSDSDNNSHQSSLPSFSTAAEQQPLDRYMQSQATYAEKTAIVKRQVIPVLEEEHYDLEDGGGGSEGSGKVNGIQPASSTTVAASNSHHETVSYDALHEAEVAALRGETRGAGGLSLMEQAAHYWTTSRSSGGRGLLGNNAVSPDNN